MLLFRHRTERSAALSQESRPSGSAQELPELPEASLSPPSRLFSLAGDIGKSGRCYALRCSTTTGLFVVVMFSHFDASRGNCAKLCQHYARNYAGIIFAPLAIRKTERSHKLLEGDSRWVLNTVTGNQIDFLWEPLQRARPHTPQYSV